MLTRVPTISLEKKKSRGFQDSRSDGMRLRSTLAAREWGRPVAEGLDWILGDAEPRVERDGDGDVGYYFRPLGGL
jgi:hypothetical protein